jgi:putative Mg2+ transporter-C (MgtC) family protein
MAAGAGLLLLATVVTALHFVIVFGYTALNRKLTGGDWTATGVKVIYEDGRGVLRDILASCTARGWSITSMTAESGTNTGLALMDTNDPTPQQLVTVKLELTGPRATDATTALGEVSGVMHVEQRQDDED